MMNRPMQYNILHLQATQITLEQINYKAVLHESNMSRNFSLLTNPFHMFGINALSMCTHWIHKKLKLPLFPKNKPYNNNNNKHYHSQAT